MDCFSVLSTLKVKGDVIVFVPQTARMSLQSWNKSFQCLSHPPPSLPAFLTQVVFDKNHYTNYFFFRK